MFLGDFRILGGDADVAPGGGIVGLAAVLCIHRTRIADPLGDRLTQYKDGTPGEGHDDRAIRSDRSGYGPHGRIHAAVCGPHRWPANPLNPFFLLSTLLNNTDFQIKI